MHLLNQRLYQTALLSVPLSIAVLLLWSCTNTKITQSWVEPDNKKSYNDIMIIGIGESESNRRAYEGYFVEELRNQKVEAVASYTLIKSDKEFDRETILKAIEGLDVDGVLITHLVGVEEETVYRNTGYGGAYGGYYGAGYYGSMYSYYPHVNSYVHDPGYYTTHETYTLESTLYDVKTEELVWTARSSSFAPESVDEVIVDLTKILIEDLQEKNLIKEK